ncbi:MAG TPA: periplasmic heavy metal sensor, partial [Burkholderiaceae bacterium]|nr:periplasmic heavy metal sensor [Burkholderiaceae bacterium]
VSSSHRVRLMAVTLAVAAAGVCVSVAQAQSAAPRDAEARHHGHGGPGGAPFGGHMLGRALDAVNATPEQRTRIGEIMKAAAADVRQQREASRGLREQAMTLFAQPTVDARAVEALRQQMVQQHDQSSRRWTQAMLDASAVLTPDQRKQLAERLKQRRDLGERHMRERRALEQPTR